MAGEYLLRIQIQILPNYLTLHVELFLINAHQLCDVSIWESVPLFLLKNVPRMSDVSIFKNLKCWSLLLMMSYGGGSGIRHPLYFGYLKPL